MDKKALGVPCGAPTHQTGEPCKAIPTAGKRRCKFHGGASDTGIAVAGYKDGRYSSVLPATLRGRYERARADEDLLSVRDDIALIDAQIGHVLSTIEETGEGGEASDTDIERIGQAFEAYQLARGSDSAGPTFAKLRATIERVRKNRRAVTESMVLVEQRRKLAETERKRLVELRQWITAEQALGMVAAIAQSALSLVI